MRRKNPYPLPCFLPCIRNPELNSGQTGDLGGFLTLLVPGVFNRARRKAKRHVMFLLHQWCWRSFKVEPTEGLVPGELLMGQGYWWKSPLHPDKEEGETDTRCSP